MNYWHHINSAHSIYSVMDVTCFRDKENRSEAALLCSVADVSVEGIDVDYVHEAQGLEGVHYLHGVTVRHRYD